MSYVSSNIFRFSIGCFFLSYSLVSFSSTVNPIYPWIVDQYLKSGYKVVAAHKVPDASSVTLYQLKRGVIVRWVPTVNNNYISGDIISKDGKSLIHDFINSFPSSDNDINKVVDEFKKTARIHWIGKKGNVVIVGIDPLDGDSYAYFKELEKSALSGDIQLGVVFVPGFRVESFNFTAKILDSEDPIAEYHVVANKYGNSSSLKDVPLYRVTRKRDHYFEKLGSIIKDRFGLDSEPFVFILSRNKSWHVLMGEVPISVIKEKVLE